MLAADVITAWAVDHPWSTADQVEQDLLLSQAICEIANDPYLGEELTFRGGTCLHKLYVNQPYPALPHIKLPYGVRTAWWSGQAKVRTFQIAELVATKIRALYQRAKGRDVFDLWLAITQLSVDPRAIAAAFEPYRPDGWTPRLAEQNLARKINESAYNNDLAQLVRTTAAGFVLADAAETILQELIRAIDG